MRTYDYCFLCDKQAQVVEGEYIRTENNPPAYDFICWECAVERAFQDDYEPDLEFYNERAWDDPYADHEAYLD